MKIANCRFAIVLLLASAAHAAQPTTRPNVLFIISDDLNTQALSCYGSTVSKTPNIDRLAARGVRFERAYCQYPLCWPSRHSFLSGRRPDERFVTAPNFRQRVPDVTFFPEHFRNNGYFTARVGKIFHCRSVMAASGPTSYEDRACWDISELGATPFDPCGYAVTFANHPKGQATHPELKGHIVRSEVLNPVSNPAADYWMDMTAVDLPDELTTDGVIAYRIAQLMSENAHRPDGKPFFLAAGFRRPHLLWVAPEKYFAQYPWEKMELPKEPADDLDDIPKAALTRGSPNMTDEQRKKAIAAYYACVAMVDAQVGKLLDQMDKLKLWDNTIVIFTSDHGWHLNQHHGLWGKVSLFQESARVPLIIVTPGMKNLTRVAGMASPRTVEMLDFYPTLCELTGLAAPTTAKLDGVSLVPHLNDPKAARPDNRPAYSVLRRGKIWGKAVYTEQFRYAEYGDDAAAGKELYDVAADPHEFTNLAQDPAYADDAKRMKALLDARIHLRDAVGAELPASD